MKKIITILCILSATSAFSQKIFNNKAQNQTAYHDLTILLKEAIEEKGTASEIKEQCHFEQVMFGKDTFAVLMVCPVTATKTKRMVVKKSFHLIEE